MLGDEYFYQAANCPDPVERLALIKIAIVSAFGTVKYRKKKPFNPMLGETFEFVTDKARYISEKVMHQPH